MTSTRSVQGLWVKAIGRGTGTRGQSGARCRRLGERLADADNDVRSGSLIWATEATAGRQAFRTSTSVLIATLQPVQSWWNGSRGAWWDALGSGGRKDIPASRSGGS